MPRQRGSIEIEDLTEPGRLDTLPVGERRIFIKTVLKRMRTQPDQMSIPEVEALIYAVDLDNAWPSNEPGKTARYLVRKLDGETKSATGSEKCLQWLICATADISPSRPGRLTGYRAVVDAMLEELAQEVERARSGKPVGRTRRVATVLVGCAGALKSREHCKRLRTYLGELEVSAPLPYADQFLTRYVVIYDKMQLERLQALYTDAYID